MFREKSVTRLLRSVQWLILDRDSEIFCLQTWYGSSEWSVWKNTCDKFGGDILGSCLMLRGVLDVIYTCKNKKLSWEIFKKKNITENPSFWVVSTVSS